MRERRPATKRMNVELSTANGHQGHRMDSDASTSATSFARGSLPLVPPGSSSRTDAERNPGDRDYGELSRRKW